MRRQSNFSLTINWIRRLSILTGMVVLTSCASGKNAELNTAGLDAGNTLPDTALAFAADRNFGRSLSSNDRELLTEAEFRALNYGTTGVPYSWNGKSKDTSGSVLVFQLFKVGKSRCRRFQHNLNLGSRSESVGGTACIKANGAWQLIE